MFPSVVMGNLCQTYGHKKSAGLLHTHAEVWTNLLITMGNQRLTHKLLVISHCSFHSSRVQFDVRLSK